MSIQTDAATLCYGLYEYPDSPVIGWDHRDDGSNSDGVYWAAVRLNGIFWCVLRGSVTDTDWRRDFEALPDPFLHDDLGLIHPGFYKGLTTVRDSFVSLSKPNEPIGVTGHSLGAGRSALLTGLLCIAKRPPAVRVCFGEPRSGTEKLAVIIANVPTSTYRNIGNGTGPFQHDLVTDVPPYLSHPNDLEDETVKPEPNDPWGMWAFHHMYLYAHAIGLQNTWSN